jgi:uncharacterized protein YeeX (DUF496 family)
MNKCCAHCGAEFGTRANLDYHAILCDFLNKSKQQQAEELQFELPSQRVMYELLVDMGLKQKRLEEKLEAITKFVAKQKKRINVLDWLNNNATPNASFEQLVDGISVTRDDVERIFDEPVLDIMNAIFTRFIYEVNVRPIYAFGQKNNVLYVFDGNIWSELTKNKMIRFLNAVQFKLSNVLYEWKKECRDEKDDKLLSQFDKATVKLMNLEFTNDATFNKVRASMYSNLKMEVKALVEYEFEF